MMRNHEKMVAVARNADILAYPRAPFSPPEIFPELCNLLNKNDVDDQNAVYPLIRETFKMLKLDTENIGTKKWSPFKGIVRKGDRVAIKPNLVFHSHPLGDDGFLSMVTHASVIRPIIDYLLVETEGDVSILICDAPLQSADFKLICNKNGLDDLVKYYMTKGIYIPIVDLRYEISTLDEEGIIINRARGDGDPDGYCVVDLNEKSAFTPIINNSQKLEITDYPVGTVSKHHNAFKNEYFISRSILKSDVFINVPKLKTHKKAGITVAMKNLIGINGDKSWIAHHRRGGIKSGGDEYETFNVSEYLKWHLNAYLKQSSSGKKVNRMIRKLYRKLFWKGKTIREMAISTGGCAKKNCMEGNWFGNDTIWRTILDLNNILFFSGKDGETFDLKQRNYVAVVDGIWSGEGNGPMEQIPRKSGVIISGFNPVAVDYAAAKIIGFNSDKIPQIANGFLNQFFILSKFPQESIDLISNFDIEKENLDFIPPDGWKRALK